MCVASFRPNLFFSLLLFLSNIQWTSHRLNCFASKEPDQAPTDLEVWTPHSTGLDVIWNEVPNGYKNGIIRGYKVQYTEMVDNASVEIEDLEPWKRSLSITGLKKFTLYNIIVLAYTSKGDGVPCSKVIMTDQDGMFSKKLKPSYPRSIARVVSFSVVDGWSRCSRSRIIDYFCDIVGISNQSTVIFFSLFFVEPTS